MTKKRDAVNVSIKVGEVQFDECLLERSLTFQTAKKAAATLPLATCPARESAGADRDRSNRPAGIAIRQ